MHHFLRYWMNQAAKPQCNLLSPVGRRNPTLLPQSLKQKSIPRAQSLIKCFDVSKLNGHTNIVHDNVSISVTSSSIRTGAMQSWSQHQPPLAVNTPACCKHTRSDSLHMSQEASSNRVPHELTNL
jgi:hypothetical protein